MKHREIRGLKPDGRGILIPASQNVEAKTGVRCTRIIKKEFYNLRTHGLNSEELLRL